MSIIIFLIILSVLIVVHELGHFLVAKYFGIRVDEFGLGYPPKAAKLFTWKGSDFTLNWLPFGGFVKIYGENPEEVDENPLTKSSDIPSEHGKTSLDNFRQPQDNFQTKNRGIQASVLVAGVFFNFIFAWFLFSLGFITGIPSPANISLPVENPHTVITMVIPGSPAETAGLRSGDSILSLKREGKEIISDDGLTLTPDEISTFIGESKDPITFVVERGKEISEKSVRPASDIIADRPAVGIAMETIGTVHLSLPQAVWNGLKTTYNLTIMTAVAIGSLIGQAFVGKADLGAVTGPVGIVGMVGDMRELGLTYLVTFTALLSINLSIINLLPFPALDGGRLLFVAIETITRRKISPRFFNAVNAAGFAILIFLMVLITIRDVRNIF